MATAAASVVAAVVAVVAATFAAAAAADRPPRGGDAAAAADRFFDDYVDGDGRVVRRDEDGSTVSEGQAYALLIAAAHGDADRFARVWEWTEAHLQRDDGLLAWLWDDGEVVDREAASDADLDAAHALAVAARRFDDPAYAAEAERIAAAAAAHAVAESDAGPVLAAGPWAADGPSTVVNPSYFSPAAYAELAAATGDPVWDELAVSSRALLGSLAGAAALPPDWAEHEGAHLRPIAHPDEARGRERAGRAAGAPRHGLDAARVAPRYAWSCDPADRAVAASWWPVLTARDRAALDLPARLDGTVDTGGPRHPLHLVAAAAAADAAGDDDAASALLDRAEAAERRHPSYYGAAWVALGRAAIGERLLDPPGCDGDGDAT